MKFIFPLLFLPLALGAQSQCIVDTKKVKALVQSWSDAHNNNDLEVFNKLYGSNVLFYTQNLTKEVCLEKKAAVLTTSNYHQEITSDLVISAYEGGIIKCDFTKHIVSNSVEKSYPSYLLLRQENNDYVIVGESDAVTDRNLKYSLDLGARVATREGQLTPIQTGKRRASQQTKTDLRWLGLAASFVMLALVIFVVSKMDFSKINLKTVQSVKANIEVAPNDGEAPGIEVAAPASPVDKYEHMGKEFERFVVTKFDRKFFAFKRWQADLGIDGRFPLANQDPDLEFLYLNSYPFAVECKFRTKLYQGKFVIERHKLDNYRLFSETNGMAVHIVLGLAGQPNSPDQLYIIPLRRFKDTNELSFDQLKKFRRRSGGDFYYDKKNDALT